MVDETRPYRLTPEEALLNSVDTTIEHLRYAQEAIGKERGIRISYDLPAGEVEQIAFIYSGRTVAESLAFPRNTPKERDSDARENTLLREMLGDNARFLDMTPWQIIEAQNRGEKGLLARLGTDSFGLHLATQIPGLNYHLEVASHYVSENPIILRVHQAISNNALY